LLVYFLDSLKPFAKDICCSVDIETILPFLISYGLITPSDQGYFYSLAPTYVEKLQKLTCLIVSLNEECVEKFLECLSETSYYAPHSSLFEKISSGMYTSS